MRLTNTAMDIPSKHRILFLEHATDGTIGGSHLCLLEILRHIDKEQYEPFVCFFEKNSLYSDFEKVCTKILIEPGPQTLKGLHFLPRFLRLPLSVTYYLYRTFIVRTWHWMTILRDFDVDLVHLNNACGYDHDLMLACRLRGIPCVVHERGIQAHIERITKFFANRVDRLIAISDAVAQNLRSGGIRASSIIRIDDGISIRRLAQKESEDEVCTRLAIDRGNPVIGIVGNLKFWKGQHVVIEALGQLIRRFPTIQCVFVGSVADAVYKEELVHRAKELGIAGRALIFTGYERNPPDLMRVMDIVIHASVDPEPFGIVLLEAMGVFRPLIATNIGGPKEIVIDQETGILTPPGDGNALAKAVEYLLSNPDKMASMTQKANERLRTHYEIQNSVLQLTAVYASLLANMHRTH